MRLNPGLNNTSVGSNSKVILLVNPAVVVVVVVVPVLIVVAAVVFVGFCNICSSN